MNDEWTQFPDPYDAPGQVGERCFFAEDVFERIYIRDGIGKVVCMVALKELLLRHKEACCSVKAYVDLATDLSYERIVFAISDLFEIKLVRSDAYDEFEAFLCEINAHDIVLMRERDLRDSPHQVYQLAIEPGFYSEAKGLPVNVSAEVREWLRFGLSNLNVAISV